MLTHELELLRAELHAPELGEVVLAQHLEASQQLCRGATLIQPEVSPSVERFETATFPLRQDDPSALHPIGFLGIDEVTHYVERAPGIGPLIRRGPFRRQPRKQGVEHAWRARQDQ